MTQRPPAVGTTAFGRSDRVIVDSPHWMEPEIPGRIAREVRHVLAASAGGQSAPANAASAGG